MPVKGHRPFMDESLASLRAQGMGDDLEIIIQDGDVEADAGESDALNKGFAKAHGEWLFWLNADDVLLPGALKAVQERIAARKVRANWIAGNVCYLNAKGFVTRCTSEWGWKLSRILDNSYCFILDFLSARSGRPRSLGESCRRCAVCLTRRFISVWIPTLGEDSGKQGFGMSR